MRCRICLAGLLAVTGAVLFAPAAQAATTVGQTAPVTGCGAPGSAQVQSLTGHDPRYTIPFDGVITSWTAATNTLSSQAKLLVLKPVSGTTYQVAAKSAFGTFTVTSPNTQTFPAQIPVQAGEVIGAWGEVCAFITMDSGDGFDRYTGAEPALGADQNFNGGLVGSARTDLSVTLEPDCDHDGLGDETQDPDTSSCHPASQPAPVSGATGERSAALASCAKRSHKRHWSHRRLKKCLKAANSLPL
jgi:hypothetical protein